MTAMVELAERMRPTCAEAVDSLEVAAVLEAEGISDVVAAERYGARDVFELAERLFGSTVRDPGTVPPPPGPWRARPARHLARGVLFALPGVCYLAVSGAVSGRGAVAVVLASLVLSWAFTQALAFLGSVRIGNEDIVGARRLLRRGLRRGCVVAALSASGLVLVGWVPLTIAVIAAAQAMYLVAATVLLVCEREWLLALALAPGTVVVGSRLLSEVSEAVPRVPDLAAVVAAAGTVLVTIVSAGRATRGVGGDPLVWDEFVAATSQGFFGLLVAGLLVFVPVACGYLGTADGGAAGGGAAGGGAAAGDDMAGVIALSVPLTLSMGPAEWIMFGFRAVTYRWLQRVHSLGAFRWRSAVAFTVAVVGYLAVLAAGLAVTAWLVPSSARAICGCLALGGALFVALLLIGCGVRVPVLVICGVALVAEYAAVSRLGAVDTQLAVAATVLFVLFAWALVVFTHATRHH